MCVALTGEGGGGASTGNLLQRAQCCLQGDCHSVADGLGVVCHRITGTLGKNIEKVSLKNTPSKLWGLINLLL